jgi:hypothetical protein
MGTAHVLGGINVCVGQQMQGNGSMGNTPENLKRTSGATACGGLGRARRTLPQPPAAFHICASKRCCTRSRSDRKVLCRAKLSATGRMLGDQPAPAGSIRRGASNRCIPVLLFQCRGTLQTGDWSEQWPPPRAGK